MSGTKHLRGNYGISGGGGRESPYLPRRDELAWDLDKRETWGGGGVGHGTEGSKARCREGGNADGSRNTALRGFT